MNKKKWLTAILIIGVLAIAFFWGGDYQKSPNKVANSSIQSQVVESTQPSATETTGITPSPQPKVTEHPVETAEPTEEAAKPIETEQPTETKQPLNSVDQKAEAASAPKADKSPAPETKVTKPVTTSEPKANTESKVTKPETKQETKKDKYLTDPVPTGKPEPVEWQDANIDKKKTLSVTLSVSAATILDNMDIFDKDKLEVLPADGIIYKAQKVTFYEGESVFDVLLREMKKNKIHMEFTMTPIYNSNYIEGINNLYEFDAGELSGWMYKVNGWFPNYGSSRYVLKDGDVIEWVYTCDLGRDVGGYSATGGQK